MGPDGDVAYLGRRQEQSWALAAAAAGGEIGASLLRSRAAALHSVANRAFARIVRLHGLGPAGIRIVPRRGRGAHRRAGIDVSTIAFNGLTLYFLNLAADAAAASRSSQHRGSGRRSEWRLRRSQSGRPRRRPAWGRLVRGPPQAHLARRPLRLRADRVEASRPQWRMARRAPPAPEGRADRGPGDLHP